MKTNDKDTYKVPEKSTYKKKYRLRVHEEHEAEEEIKKFDLKEPIEHENCPTRSNPT